MASSDLRSHDQETLNKKIQHFMQRKDNKKVSCLVNQGSIMLAFTFPYVAVVCDTWCPHAVLRN